MPQATRIVIEFDDGSTHVVDPKRFGSIFMNEAKAIACGNRPPYDKPPQKNNGNNTMNGTTTLMSTSTDAADDSDQQGGGCYLINGVIICT